ncbi:MAG: GPW/gp25 family protein [Reichenbachiella sp.]|uniref:GPW/gp25 family protein n=1 Tax=Reichenbachiella sp. TaxID=2184521 RepID=UPI003263D967
MKQQDQKIATLGQSFLGTGWSFPPVFSLEDQRVETTSEEQDIQKSLEIILGTSPGERIMQPDFGCDLSSLSFEPITTALESHIQDLVKSSILFHEARIRVEDVRIQADEAQEGKVLISIEYMIRTTNTRSNYVFPYYVNEATISSP